MTDDIVARLRKEISKRDRPYPVELLPELREAADEIERLRRHYSEAEKDHVECVAEYHNAKMEIERLRARIDELEAERAPAP